MQVAGDLTIHLLLHLYIHPTHTSSAHFTSFKKVSIVALENTAAENSYRNSHDRGKNISGNAPDLIKDLSSSMGDVWSGVEWYDIC